MQEDLTLNAIAYIVYANPAAYPPLEHSSSILAGRGWRVFFFGSRAEGALDRLCFPDHPGVSVKRWRHVSPGWRQKLHYLAFIIWCLGHILQKDLRWIYCSDPFSLPVAWLAMLLPGRKVIYHEHDSPDPVPETFFQRCILALRRRIGRDAEAVVFPNEERAKIYVVQARPACPLLIVWNCPRREEVKARVIANEDRVTLFYHGSLNPLRLPFTVLQAMALAESRPILRFAGYTTAGHHGFVAEFLAEAKRLGLEDSVSYLGALAGRADLLECCATAQIGLAFMPTRSADLNMRAMAGASNKPFDYLASGLALIVSDLPEWRSLYVEAGVAQACTPERAESIAAAIAAWQDDPARHQAARTRGRELVRSQWNYETQFSPVLNLLERDAASWRVAV